MTGVKVTRVALMMGVLASSLGCDTDGNDASDVGCPWTNEEALALLDASRCPPGYRLDVSEAFSDAICVPVAISVVIESQEFATLREIRVARASGESWVVQMNDGTSTICDENGIVGQMHIVVVLSSREIVMCRADRVSEYGQCAACVDGGCERLTGW